MIMLRSDAARRYRALPRPARDALLLTVACTLTTLPLLPSLPIWAGIGAMTLIIWRAALAWRGAALPRRAWLAALLLAGVTATGVQFHTVLGRDPGVVLVTLLLGLKGLEASRRRDTYVLTGLGLFTVAAHFLESQSPGAALWMVMSTPAWLLVLMSANLPTEGPSLRVRLARACGLLALGLPLMVVLFIIVPRMSAPLWALPADASARTGLGDAMDAGAIARLARNDSVVFRVHFDGPTPPPRALYWRGPVLEDFDGLRWRALPRPHLASGHAADAHLRVHGAGIRYTVTLQPTGHRTVFALDAVGDAPVIDGQQNTTVKRGPDLTLRASKALDALTRYRLLSYPRFEFGTRAPTPQLGSDLALPAGANPRTVALGRSMALRAGNNAQRIAASALSLFSDAPFHYSLSPGAYPGVNQVDSFLFERRVGFCEHFAQAFVVLMRAAGVPARVVTGYQGGRANPLDGSWVVRQSDAHAWAEYWVAGHGWERADPTAMVDPARVDRSGDTLAASAPLLGIAALGPGGNAALQPLRDLADAMNQAWNTWVLDYDERRRDNLWQRWAGDDWRAPGALLLAGLAVMFGLPLVRVQRRRIADPWQSAYAGLCRKLRRAGVAAGTVDPPALRARRLDTSELAPSERERAQTILGQMERLRFGRPGNAPSLRTLRRSIASLRPARKR